MSTSAVKRPPLGPATNGAIELLCQGAWLDTGGRTLLHRARTWSTSRYHRGTGFKNHTHKRSSLFRPRGPWLVVAVMALAAPWLNIPRDQADSAGMLAHLHGFFIDGDLLYDNEYFALGMSPLFAFVTDQGVVSNHWPVGATWLQAPAYLTGVLLARVLNAVDIGNGSALGPVPLLAVRAWAVLLLAALSWATSRWVSRATVPAAGPMTAAAMVVGTPLFYYASEAPLRPHLYGALVVFALVSMWSRPSQDGGSGRAALLGSLAGWATAIRPQLAPLLLLAAHDGWSTPQRLRTTAIALLAFLPWPLLLGRAQFWIYGEQLFSYTEPATHHLWQFLLSPHHGALIWCPVLALGFFGLILGVFHRRRGSWLLLILIAMQLWIDSGLREIEPRSVLGTRTWSGGLAFGPRKLVDVLPLLLPGVIVLIRAARERGWHRRLAVVASILCLPTVLLHVAAFVQPSVTERVLDWPDLARAFTLAGQPSRLLPALDARSLPPVVGLAMTLVLVGPALLLGRIAHRSWLGWRDVQRERAGVLGVLCAALIAHGWLSVLIVRSEAILDDDPHRMALAHRAMLPAHLATVRRISAGFTTSIEENEP